MVAQLAPTQLEEPLWVTRARDRAYRFAKLHEHARYVWSRAQPPCSRYWPCRGCTKLRLRLADSQGDGPMVNALCAYGRIRWGADFDW